MVFHDCLISACRVSCRDLVDVVDTTSRSCSGALLRGWKEKLTCAWRCYWDFCACFLREAKLLSSMANHGPTWLHHLHLCILQTQNGGNGTKHCAASASLRPNPMASFLLGDLEQAFQLAVQAVASTQHTQPDPERAEVDLLRDLSVVRIQRMQVASDYEALRAVLVALEQLPPVVAKRLLATQPMRIAAIYIALHLHNDPDEAIDLLLDKNLNRGWAVSTPALVPLWRDAWALKATRAKGAPLDLLEAIKLRRDHPPPSMLFFGGAT